MSRPDPRSPSHRAPSRPLRQVARTANTALMGGPRAFSTPADRDLASAIGGRTVLVTGASAGIGRAVARRCGAAGATVVLVARSADALEQVAGEVREDGGTAHVLPADLADGDSVAALGEALGGLVERVDVLVNNAGRSIRRPVMDSLDRFHDVERTIQLNYLGAVRMIHLVLPGMVEAGDGHIVNCSTMGTKVFPSRFAAYLGSKCALEGYSASLGTELVSRGIDVTTVHLPLVRTEMIAPTEVYRRAPALTADQGAAMVTSALVDRPSRVLSPAGHALQAVRTVAPGTTTRALSAVIRRMGGRIGA